VIKVSNGYITDNTEFMCRTMYHLATVGYKGICLSIPKKVSNNNNNDDSNDDRSK